MEETTCRNVRIDIMRAVAMLLIVCGHFINHGINRVILFSPPHMRLSLKAHKESLISACCSFWDMPSALEQTCFL